jgi:hypothetical protein
VNQIIVDARLDIHTFHIRIIKSIGANIIANRRKHFQVFDFHVSQINISATFQ